jgi:hypothetical protein
MGNSKSSFYGTIAYWLCFFLYIWRLNDYNYPINVYLKHFILFYNNAYVGKTKIVVFLLPSGEA